MALVRIKRRASDEPIDSLLLASKKLKTEGKPITKVFKFIATAKDNTDDVNSHFTEVIKTEKEFPKERKNILEDITEKLRAENKLFSKNNRLKVINCYRAVNPEFSTDEFRVVDIESSDLTHEGSTDSNNLAPPVQFVYDLYYTKVGDFDDLQMENALSAHPVESELVFGDNEEEEEDNIDDEDDSNDENNWRNDYPDSDPDGEESDSSIDDDDMRLATSMKTCVIDGEYSSDLSSDRDDVYDDAQDKHYFFDANSGSSSDSEFN